MHCPIVLKLGRLLHCGPYNESRERLTGLAASSGNAAIVLNKILYALPVFFGYWTEGKNTCCRECCIQPVADDSLLIFTISRY